MTWTTHNPNDKVFYVYQYLREDLTPFYIGKGCGKRISNPHNFPIPKSAKHRQFVKTGLTENEALLLEGQLTHQFGLLIDGTGILENKIHGGGDISPRGFLGKTHSDESKTRMSLANMGQLRTDEQKQNYKGVAATLDAEMIRRDKIRQANLGRDNTDRNAKVSATKKGKPWSQARRDAQSKRKNT